MTLKKRESKGIQMVINNDVRPISQSKFLVRSQSNSNKWYEVTWQRNRWCCNCEDYARRSKRCKHVHAVCYYIALQNLTLGAKSLETESHCPTCGSSSLVIKRGVRYNQSGPVQRYYCKKCRIRFVCRTAFQRMRSKVAAIVSALDLYFRGLSLRQVAEHLEYTCGIKVTHGTIHNWIKKYVRLVNEYVTTLQVNSSSRWHMDDTLVKVSGRHMVLWALLDSETRFLLALHISSKRGAEEAQALIRKGLTTAKNEPSELISDGLGSYHVAIEREFKANPGKRNVVHIQGPLTASFNNKIERFHGVLKGRLKTMCQLNSEETAKTFAKGFEVYYNFIKTHKALNGKTPAQAAGLTLKKNTWLDLILNADKHTE